MLTFAFIHFFSVGKSQVGLCPPNLDFEMGNFTNWTLYTATADSLIPINNWNWAVQPIPITNRHKIITAATAGTDSYGNFPELCPNGSNYSIRLGNSLTGSQAEKITYTFTIPASLSVFSMLFNYAIVYSNPEEHNINEQPRFRAVITDLSTDLPIPCVNFDFIAAVSPPGFLPSPINAGVLYKGWTPVSVNLNEYIGKAIQIEFTTNDCTQNGHFGYAYIDINSTCNGAISGTTICAGENKITLTAPHGFKNYKWYDDLAFTNLLSGNQTLPLTPAPTVGTVFPVIVEPYPGFGCKDTLYATISIANKPPSVAGVDTAICQGQQIQIGAASTSGYIYEWTPAAQLNDPKVSNPIAWTDPPDPIEFIVKTTDLLTGCFSYDTTYVTTISIDTSITIAGKRSYCIGEPGGAVLSVNNLSTNINWYNGTAMIPGATAITYQPTTTGFYWAEIKRGGCVDTTSIIPIGVHALPVVLFIADKDTACISQSNFIFTNKSTIADNSLLFHLWKFSDGDMLTTNDATKSFVSPGTYTAKLTTTTAFGCIDSSAATTLFVMPNGSPDFVWDSICVGRPLLFKNISNENGSTSVAYNWNFNNGNPATVLKNPPPIVYATPGKIDVILKMVTLGCESDTQTIVKKVSVNGQSSGVRYKDITVPQGSSQFIHARDIGKNYLWRPQMQLSSYQTRYTEFFATSNDIDYKIDMIDEHTCATTDTVQLLILRKPGYYLPTAFTPNGDGLNDIAIPYLVSMKSLSSFSIYNRWGNRIFYTTTEGKGWDGKFNGVPQDSGVYIWILEFINSDNKKVTEKGSLTIIR